MLYAVNKNKEVAIDEKDMEAFLNEGYDIYEVANGKSKLKKASSMKKVSYEAYKKLEEEIKKLKAEIKKLKEATK